MEHELSETQVRILESLYFVETFSTIVDESRLPAAIVGAELKVLISKRWVQVMAFDEKSQDYLPVPFYDGDHMKNASFLATKQGLMLLHGGSMK